MSDSPDEYTNTWWRKQTRGIMHSVNRCNSDYADTWEAVKDLKEKMILMHGTIETIRADIGKLQETIERAREAYSEIRKQNGRVE